MNAMDGRLFCNELLYCEGREKCLMRGKIHFFSLFVFPFLLWIYYEAAKYNVKALSIGYVYLLMNFMAYGISCLFHMGSWSKEQEIIIQKLDHCFVAMYVTSKYLPMALLLLPTYIGTIHIAAATMICIWNNINVWNSRPDSMRLALLAATQFPFFYYYYELMTPIEWACNWIAIISQSIAGYIFVNEITPSWMNPQIATFHELYHMLSLITGISMWILNYSIIQRA